MPLAYPIPQFVPRLKVTAADHMEPIRLDIVDLDARLGNVSSANPAASRLAALEGSVNDGGTGIPALNTKVNALATRVGNTESSITANTAAIGAAVPRISALETRTGDPATGNVALGNRVTALETRPQGEWRIGDTAQGVPADPGNISPPAMKFAQMVRTPIGITQSATGTFTAGVAGWWDLAAQVDLKLELPTSTWYRVGAIISFTDGRSIAADTMYIPANGWAGSVSSAPVYLAAGSQFDFRLWVYTGSGAGTVYPVSPARSFFRALCVSKQ